MATVRRSTALGKDVGKDLVRQPGGLMRENKDGTIECVEKYRCLYSVALSKKPIRNESVHPVFKSLYCQDVSIVEVEADMAELSVTYIGDPSTDGVISSSRLPDPVFELLTEASEEPIETHPYFTSILGLTSNGAKYDSNNIFLGYEKTSPYKGVTGYLAPRSVWRETGARKTKPSALELNQVGTRNTPTGAQTPSTPSGRDWLLRSFNYTYEGKIYRYQKEWLLSGPGGWNTDIYD